MTFTAIGGDHLRRDQQYDAASGRLRKAWVFVLVRSFSRRIVARIVFDQKIETWLLVYVEAGEAYTVHLRDCVHIGTMADISHSIAV